jgi:hypothetical protein
VDELDAAYGHPPYEKEIVDPDAYEWVTIIANFRRILRFKEPQSSSPLAAPQ